MSDQSLKRTPLYEAHARRGARFTAFAGYDMPVQYADGVLAEHRWTRAHAGLFDVSHMGAALLELNRPGFDPEANHRSVSVLLEQLVPGDIIGLGRGQAQ